MVFAMPVFDGIESCLVKNLKFTPSTCLRIVGRTSYVALVGFIAVCIPFFRRSCFLLNVLLLAMHYMVGHETTKTLELSLDCILDLDNSWSPNRGVSTNRWSETDHPSSQNL
ncbi:unnamed protein product [Arabidopsis thaliana]|nr:unnamed protein product [Arabidopsis thaliana]